MQQQGKKSKLMPKWCQICNLISFSSKDFIMTLSQKNIVLIIGGGIAAYKALDLIRRLRERGAKLHVVMTRDGEKFVTPLTVAALAGQTVYRDLFAAQDGYDIGHIRLARAADLILIAPLTASRMAKMATGLAEDLAGAVLLAASCPIVGVPAMNPHMWAHVATRRNLEQLLADGVEFIGPQWGEMAESGEAGLGRMSDVADIVAHVERILAPQLAKPLAGHHIIITAGPTHEPIDPVRFLANRSSGKQGYAIAAALAEMGADVTLVSGPVQLPEPAGIKLVRVETAVEMLAAVEQSLPAEVAIFVAAVADWRMQQPERQKMKKNKGETSLTLELIQNPDILATIAKGSHRPHLVIGFAAETSETISHGKKKLREKKADWIIANNVSMADDGGSIMGGDETSVHILSEEGIESWPRMSKQEMAGKLAHKIADVLTGMGE